MGMSASQARYLQLTARRSDIEYQMQQINQAQMALMDSMDAIAAEYNAAISNRNFFFVSPFDPSNGDNTTNVLDYYDIVRSLKEGGLGQQIVDAYGNIVVPKFPENLEDGYKSGDYHVDENIGDSEYFEQCLRNGTYFIAELKETETGEKRWLQTDYSTNVYVQDCLDKSDDAAAERIYEQKMAQAHRKDRMLTTSKQKLDTEWNAINTEIESVQKVIEKHTDSFKDTFG